MPPHKRLLKKGQQVWALIEENIALNEVIVNFGGDLIRVRNETMGKLRVGQRVLLHVVKTGPLEFRLVNLVETRSAMRRKELDVMI